MKFAHLSHYSDLIGFMIFKCGSGYKNLEETLYIVKKIGAILNPFLVKRSCAIDRLNAEQSAFGVDNLRAHRHTPHPRFGRALCSGVFTPLRCFIPRNSAPEIICKNGYSICKSFNDCYSESSYLAP